ncbi:Probable beta-galactosidase B [Galdieria sulphuraria]|nr:Probable beta-galactosidase B [Galdieria sulphuraria]
MVKHTWNSKTTDNSSSFTQSQSFGPFFCSKERTSTNQEPSAFRKETYASHLTWTRRCLLIEGKPIPILSAEFHYWRIPDRNRWKRILESYRSLGFNCVRIYFHWGFHSPRQGVYDFQGNRDIEYLLQLCEELHLFVIAAPGPYICAETQCGGFPTWLVAKREIRIRHVAREFIKRWDQQFFEYCKEWYAQFLPILVSHERATHSRGCVIALQIENELMQWLAFFRIGLDKELRSLAELAREMGVYSPIIHNDAMPDGSWTRGKRNRLWWSLGLISSSRRSYRVDLYGMDLYVTWPPDNGDQREGSLFELDIKDILSIVRMSNGNGLSHEATFVPFRNASWKKHRFARAFDKLERTTSGFGGAATSGPVIVCEAQGGWYNQWGRRRTYDDMFTFFGEDHTSNVLVSLLAQGITMINIYMFYGGTNYGCLGDTEVYTSYDYAASIREYGFITNKARKVAAVNLFFRTFANFGLIETERLSRSDEYGVQCSLSNVVICTRWVRKSVSNHEDEVCYPRIAFLRNFSSVSKFTLALQGVAVTCSLEPRQVMLVPCDIPLSDKVVLHISGIQIVVRMKHLDTELWVLSLKDPEVGRIAFRSRVPLILKWCSIDGQYSGTCDPNREDDETSDLTNIPAEELSFGAFRNGTFINDDHLRQDCASLVRREETIGQVYHLSVWKPCFILLSSRENEHGTTTTRDQIRLVCLNSADASTVTCNWMEQERDIWSSQEETSRNPEAIAWGAYRLYFDSQGQLQISCTCSDTNIYFLRQGECPVMFQPMPCVVEQHIPYCFVCVLTDKMRLLSSLSTSSSSFIRWTSPWQSAYLDWNMIPWKPINYATERNPLDHLFTHGHCLYRCNFHIGRRLWLQNELTLKLNCRHLAVVWCNGKCVGSHLTYSHHIVGPGAVNFWDVSYSGNMNYDLTPYLKKNDNGVFENVQQQVIVLIHNFGQGRQPFVVNDVRNPRGLLSASFHGIPVEQVAWYISGRNVSELEDPFNTVGIPLEDKLIGQIVGNNPFRYSREDIQRGDENTRMYYQEMTTLVSSETFQSSSHLSNVVLKLDNSSFLFPVYSSAGMGWWRAKFRLPEILESFDGRLHMPLALCISGNAHCFAWINQLQIARYVAKVGPQTVFYIPCGLLLSDEENVLTIMYYTEHETAQVGIRITPYFVDSKTGNWKNEGERSLDGTAPRLFLLLL